MRGLGQVSFLPKLQATTYNNNHNRKTQHRGGCTPGVFRRDKYSLQNGEGFTSHTGFINPSRLDSRPGSFPIPLAVRAFLMAEKNGKWAEFEAFNTPLAPRRLFIDIDDCLTY